MWTGDGHVSGGPHRGDDGRRRSSQVRSQGTDHVDEHTPVGADRDHTHQHRVVRIARDQMRARHHGRRVGRLTQVAERQIVEL